MSVLAIGFGIAIIIFTDEESETGSGSSATNKFIANPIVIDSPSCYECAHTRGTM